MTPGERYFIREKIAQEKPEHLGGFDEDWLLLRTIPMRYGEVIQVFTITDNGPEFITSVVF